MYSDYQQPTQNKRKIILVSVIMGLIILVLIGVLVNAIIRKNRLALGKKTSDGNSSYVLDQDGNVVNSNTSVNDANNSGANSATTSGSEGQQSGDASNSNSNANAVAATGNNSGTSTNNSASNSGTSNSSATSNSAGNTSNPSAVANTGPAEVINVLGFSLLLGTVTAYLLSKNKFHLENR